jgi:CheY-like chemotaxis protein
LINDVLDIAKMEAGRIEWRDQPLDLATVIRQAVQNVQAMAIGKQLTLTVQLDEIGVPVVADPDRILQVIANLLSNAIKFTDRGTVTVTARPLAAGEEVHGWRAPLPHHSGGAAEGPGGVLVTVQDTGVGIPAEALPRLFQRFQQIGDTLRDKPKGTGLGLAISREIVTHYGGAIWAESEVGVGSLFCFTLPLMPTAPATPLKSPVQPETTGRSPVDPQSCTLLVVDDDGAIRALLRQTLSEVGYQVLEAADGAVAIAEARRSRPDLLILDVRMPGLSGFDVIQVLKSDPNTVQIPILILSVEAQQRSLELGAAAQLTKPVDPELLLKTVARLLQIGRAAEQPARWRESA